MNSTHIKSGGVYEIRHVSAAWLPSISVADGADILVMRNDLTGEVAAQSASDAIPVGHSVISGAVLQKDANTDLSVRVTMVIYANAQGNQFGRELNEFNARFDPPITVSAPTTPDA